MCTGGYTGARCMRVWGYSGEVQERVLETTGRLRWSEKWRTTRGYEKQGEENEGRKNVVHSDARRRRTQRSKHKAETEDTAKQAPSAKRRPESNSETKNRRGETKRPLREPTERPALLKRPPSRRFKMQRNSIYHHRRPSERTWGQEALRNDFSSVLGAAFFLADFNSLSLSLAPSHS